MDKQKPVCFIDVDGVILRSNARPFQWAGHPHEHTTVVIDGENIPMTWGPDVIAFINDLSEKVDIVWLTSWCQQANTILAPTVGINSTFPVGFDLAEVTVPGSGVPLFSYKKTVVSHLVLGKPFDADPAMFSGRKVIWVDDELTSWVQQAMGQAFVEAGEDVLMVKPTLHSGLLPEHLEQITTFIS